MMLPLTGPAAEVNGAVLGGVAICGIGMLPALDQLSLGSEVEAVPTVALVEPVLDVPRCATCIAPLMMRFLAPANWD